MADSKLVDRDSTRYDYKHSILVRKDDPGQRLSIMIRVRAFSHPVQVSHDRPQDRSPENRAMS